MLFDDILKKIDFISENKELKQKILDLMIEVLDLRKNDFHPLVFILGEPEIGKNVYIGIFTEVFAKRAKVIIGDNCDIGSFVSINAADSCLKCIGKMKKAKSGDITIENNVCVGTHSFVGRNVHIGHHSIIGADTVVKNCGYVPPYSLIVGNPAIIKKGYYL